MSNFHSLEWAVRLYRDPQLQMDENYVFLFNLRPNICKSNKIMDRLIVLKAYTRQSLFMGLRLDFSYDVNLPFDWTWFSLGEADKKHAVEITNILNEYFL